MTDRILNERYILEANVGEGGMAVTYRARDLLLNRTVAVKVMREQFTADPQFVERFRREAQAAARLSHPNIAGVYDTGRCNGAYYIVMEYVEGVNLKQRLRREGQLPVTAALEIARQIAAALDAAHRGGLVHRDVKPHNILINAEGKVKVTDFGIAKLASESEDTGVIMGSVHYLSPEQARGEATTPASDLYALGAVLFEMLTGRTLFEGENAMAVAHKQIYTPAPRPGSLRPELPPAVEAVVLRCLEKDPRARYQSAAELEAVFARLVNQLSQEETLVTAAPPPPMDATVVYRPPAPPARARPPQRAAPRIHDEPPPGGGGNGWLIAVLFLLLAGAVVTGGYFFFKPPPPTPPPQGDKVVVPDLVAAGLTETQAKDLLDKRNLKWEMAKEIHETVPEGKVCRQDPAPNLLVEEGASVFFWISEGSVNFTMPDVSGMSLDAAKREIRLAGFKAPNFIVAKEPAEGIEKGFVVRTEPEPDALVARNGKVTLVLSEGAPVVERKKEVFQPGKAPDAGYDPVYVRIEFERPAGSDPKLMFEGTFAPRDPIADQRFERDPNETVIVRMLVGKDRTSRLEVYKEETFGL